MKKNLMIKVAAMMLILALASTCMIGTTFAKYVTNDSASDTARVAKWGITVSTSGVLFGEAYDSEIVVNDGSSLKVQTSSTVGSDDDVVAPGTQNTTGFQVKLSGTPEVKYDVTANNNSVVAEDIFLAAGDWGIMVPVYGVTEVTDISGYYTKDNSTSVYTLNGATAFDNSEIYYELTNEVTVAAGGYYPIQWTLTSVGADVPTGVDSIAVTDASNLVDIAANLIGAIDDLSGIPNDTLDATYKLTWKWLYNVDDDTDEMDTILGNLMAASADHDVVFVKDSKYTSSAALVDGTDYNLEIAFGISITVTQVD